MAGRINRPATDYRWKKGQRLRPQARVEKQPRWKRSS